MYETEKDIERYFAKKVKAQGWECLKFVSPGNIGVPDRVVILPDGVTVIFVELKAPGGKLRKSQEAMRLRFEALNHRVFIVDSKNNVDFLIAKLRAILMSDSARKYSLILKGV